MSEEKSLQKLKWTEKKRYDTFPEADTLRNALKEDGLDHVKVKRCGPEGTRFKVVVGSEINKNKKTKTKKEK